MITRAAVIGGVVGWLLACAGSGLGPAVTVAASAQRTTVSITLTTEEATAIQAMLDARPAPIRRAEDTPESWVEGQARHAIAGVVRQYLAVQAQARAEAVRTLQDRATRCATAELALGVPIAGCER